MCIFAVGLLLSRPSLSFLLAVAVFALKLITLPSSRPPEWVKLTFHDRERNRLVQRGRVAISIHIVPEAEYENDPVGSGRSEPNKDPYLPPPTGRFSFSIDPIKILSELCPVWLRWCICCCCCCCCCIIFLILAMTQLSGVMSLVDLIESLTPTDPPTMAPSYSFFLPGGTTSPTST